MEQYEQFRERFRIILPTKKVIEGSLLDKLGYNPRTVNEEQLYKKLNELAIPLEIEIRADPLFGVEHSLHNTIISEERATRPGLPKKEEKLPIKETCDFCTSDRGKKEGIFYKTGIPKIFHEEGIISVPNLCPYIEPNFVTMLLSEHDLQNPSRLEDVTVSIMETFLETGKKLMTDEIKNHVAGRHKCVGAWDFINWGAKAGATQPQHPHAQRGGLYAIMRPLMKKESDLIGLLNRTGEDNFEKYLTIMKFSPLNIYEDDFVIVFAPFAPKFTDQVDIVTKKVNEKIVRNYFELTDNYIKAVASSLTNVLKKLGNKRNIQNVNVATHQAYFDYDGDYRMHWHIYPRESIMAGMEFNDIYIVSAYPEDTAKALK